MATIKIKTNIDCYINIDDEYSTTAFTNKITKINIQHAGMYYIKAVPIIFNTIETLKNASTKYQSIELPNKDYEYLLDLDFTSELIDVLLFYLKTVSTHIDKNLFSFLFNSQKYLNQIKETKKSSIFKDKISKCERIIQDQLNYARNQILNVDWKSILKLNCSLIGRNITDNEYEDKFATIIYHDYGFQINLPYNFYEDFKYGFAIVSYDGRYGIIDKAGNLILPCKYKCIEFLFPGGEDSTKYLHGIIKENAYSKDILYYFTIYAYDELMELDIDLHERFKCVYNEELCIVALYLPVKEYMKEYNIQNEEYLIEEVGHIDIIDSKESFWYIPDEWWEIKEITDNRYIIFYKPNEGYGISIIDLESHSFEKPLISGCKEIFYLGDDYFIVRMFENTNEQTYIEKLYQEKYPAERFWKFSETATIFNSEIFSAKPFGGIITNHYTNEKDDVLCEVYYINHKPNLWCDMERFNDIVFVKGKIIYEDWGSCHLEKKAFNSAGNDITDFLSNYFIDWESWIEL